MVTFQFIHLLTSYFCVSKTKQTIELYLYFTGHDNNMCFPLIMMLCRRLSHVQADDPRILGHLTL